MCKVQLEYKYKSVLKIPQSFTGRKETQRQAFPISELGITIRT